MAAVRVRTPVPDHSGSVGAVQFSNGVGYADTEQHEAEIAYFERRGYVIEAVENEPEAADEPDGKEQDTEDEEVPPPAKNASTEAWRAWAVEHGGLSTEDAADLTRDQLVERFADNEEN